MLQQKSLVDEPNDAYDSLYPTWRKCRAFASGQEFVKSMDTIPSHNNFLLPFSPTMSLEQYSLFKAEAELPGITSQFIEIIVGGLLRKPPIIVYNKEVPEEAKEWIVGGVTENNGSLVSLLNDVLQEEMQTSRAWLYIDYPTVDDQVAKNFSTNDWTKVKPYVVVIKAESIINWQTAMINGEFKLMRLIVRGFVDKYATQEDFHPTSVDTIWVHELIDGKYQIRLFEQLAADDKEFIQGQEQIGKASGFQLVTTVEPKSFGQPMNYIPAWPANGSVECIDPFITTFVNKEQALYNVMSRRNHLLYGAATYTPWIASDMSGDDFESLVNQGLGTWIRLRKGDTIGVLQTPVDALADLESSIKNKLEELAKLGIRFLAPETAQSGVALTIRSAAQVATLGVLNTKISSIMSVVIMNLINRRYNLQLMSNDVSFSLSPDFDPTAIGQDYLRLITEIYEKGLIPREQWIRLLKANEMLSPDYNDERGQELMAEDELVQPTSNQVEDGLSAASRISSNLKLV